MSSLLRVFGALTTLPLALVLWTLYCLGRNHARARSIGLPITVRFITPGGPLWMIFSPLVIHVATYLPFTASFIQKYRRGWECRERYRTHEEHGELFTICTPGGNFVKIGNFEVADDILKRKDDFGRDLEAFAVLNIYGKNLATTEGKDWMRHRKVAAVTFTEKNAELVWGESLKEASQMLVYWMERAKKPIRTLAQDTQIFSLNVLAAALFDRSYPFEGRQESKLREEATSSETKDGAFGYRDSIATILHMIVPIMVFGERKLRDSWWLPKGWQKAGYAVANFRKYVTDLINEERLSIAQGKAGSANLVTNLVRACEDERSGSLSTESSTNSKAILTKDEIISDLFVFAFAGNDTTALTLAYILAELAAHPSIQDWISAEIRHYTATEDVTNWDYTTCMKLKRCWAVMYETLRLSHPINQLVKNTGAEPRIITHRGATYLIPAHTTVEINLPSLSTMPRHWGSDSLEWNPKRFITPAHQFEDEIIPPDTTSTFYPWAYSRLVCPGKRFSQAELVAALAALFRDHRVEPVPEAGETMQEACRRVKTMSEDIEQRLLSEMREPEKIALQWYQAKN
ncbi:cytochrome P450 monooxygenase-like protein [Karstenula rhodostoma CBS 690.94]|uniref:Cytochrome P450 monooxygenase-like protein n=1 Tax=Karstenula rhodostoma CBS 690.94 TaxID=1392251 RepID=A0A9P4U777_9PLEO|nr:cytochrome P450 monooxygenase-like protein [Karstenula rhodostoma CBS 690.94]